MDATAQIEEFVGQDGQSSARRLLRPRTSAPTAWDLILHGRPSGQNTLARIIARAGTPRHTSPALNGVLGGVKELRAGWRPRASGSVAWLRSFLFIDEVASLNRPSRTPCCPGENGTVTLIAPTPKTCLRGEQGVGGGRSRCSGCAPGAAELGQLLRGPC